MSRISSFSYFGNFIKPFSHENQSPDPPFGIADSAPGLSLAGTE
jgi:hypothetical protein